MSDNARQLSPKEVVQTMANLRLATQFVQDLIDDPEHHDMLPDGATVVLLPSDDAPDTELTFANIEMAKQLARQGWRPVVWAVRQPAIPGPQGLTRWPIVHEHMRSISFDRLRDTLTVRFSETDRPTISMRQNPYVTMLVDPETNIVVRFVIPLFLEVVAPKSLALLNLLLLPETELVGISREEIQEIRNRLAHGKPVPHQEPATAGEIFEELARLTA